MSDFADTYKQIVVPRLAQHIDRCAPAVAMGIITFEDVAWGVEIIARKRGAAFLHPAIVQDLEAWIANRLLTKTIEFEDKYPDICEPADAE